MLGTETDVVEKKPKMCRVEQLQVVRTLGQGAFGQVSLVYFDDKFYALKAVPRSKVRGSKQAKQVLSERDILLSLAQTDEFFCGFYESLQDEDNLYLLLEYIPGG